MHTDGDFKNQKKGHIESTSYWRILVPLNGLLSQREGPSCFNHCWSIAGSTAVAVSSCILFVPVDPKLLQGRSDGSRGLLKVVVGNLGEKEVVCHMTIGDVVVSVVDAPAVLSVYGLHRCRGEVEVRVVERLCKTTGYEPEASCSRASGERGKGGARVKKCLQQHNKCRSITGSHPCVRTTDTRKRQESRCRGDARLVGVGLGRKERPHAEDGMGH